MTVDVSVRSGALSAEDWIISFPDGPPTYSKDWTVAKCSYRQKFRAAAEPEMSWQDMKSLSDAHVRFFNEER
jgi:hypothetical protein